MTDRIPKYTINDLPKIRQKYKPGDCISIRKDIETEDRRRVSRQIRYRIIKRYPYHLSCADIKTGVLESFNYFMLDRDRYRILE